MNRLLLVAGLLLSVTGCLEPDPSKFYRAATITCNGTERHECIDAYTWRDGSTCRLQDGRVLSWSPSVPCTLERKEK